MIYSLHCSCLTLKWKLMEQPSFYFWWWIDEDVLTFQLSISTQSELQALISGCLISYYASVECTKVYLLRQWLHCYILKRILRFNFTVFLALQSITVIYSAFKMRFSILEIIFLEFSNFINRRWVSNFKSRN